MTDPYELARLRSGATIDNALERARDAEASLDAYTFEARYNPAACACPAWEIVMHGRWTRIWLDTVPEAADELTALQARAEAEVAASPSYAVTGRLADPTEAETGMSYPTLQLIPATQPPEDE